MSQKGHLGVGADADVTIYNEKPDADRMFGYPRYVIKGGEIVVEEGDIRNMTPRAASSSSSLPTIQQIEDYLRRLFQQVLHDVLRKLPRGDGPYRPTGDPTLPVDR